MPRNRVIYQSELLYVGPTGARPATGAHTAASTYGNITSAASGILLGSGYIAELYRVQNVSHSWNKRLTDVNQFGELAAIDRVSIEPPTVSLSYSWLQNNLINESLLGMTVSNVGQPQVSCVSGILNGTTDQKNYFLKIVGEGNDASDFNPASYDVISFGNAYLSSYTAQGQVGSFPTVDVSLSCLNAQAQTITQTVGGVIPAVFPTDGTSVSGWGYVLPTGLTSYANATLTAANNYGISVLRPGDITLSLGLGAGEGFVAESDLKIQSYNISFSLNQEDLTKLGTKYAYAKLPTFPVQATMTVNAIIGDMQTGSLVEIVNNNTTFNPIVNIVKPGTTTAVVNYQLKGAKLESQDWSSAIGSNGTVNMTFTSQIGGPQDLSNGLFLSGVTV